MSDRTIQRRLSAAQRASVLATLAKRFQDHPARHEGIVWDDVRKRLEAEPRKLWSLQAMEASGGEPDVIGGDGKTGTLLFVDCAAESPAGRRSVCYDRAGLESRKEHRPQDSAMDMAAAMGIELLTEEQYRKLQELGDFDQKTSSWLKTPADVRQLGGALFGDRRYGRVFVYHNGAQSYYGVRGFRGSLWI